MITPVNLLQSLAGDMGVYLSGGDIHMAKHHLNRTKVCSPLQKVARKGMAEKMRGDPLAHASLSSIHF